MLLLLLSEAPRHGYALEEKLETLGDFNLGTGSLYRELRRPEALDLVAPTWELSDQSATPRRVYEVTSAGRRRLKEWMVEAQTLMAAIDRLLEGQALDGDSPKPS